MNRNPIRSAMFGTLLLLGASLAHSQQPANLGDLLDKGGKRLDAAELKALLTGATATGTTMGGQLDAETTYAPDGKLSGRFWGGHPEMPPFFTGTWNITEQGQICFDMMAAAPRIGRVKGCNQYYSLNTDYYTAASEDRSTIVRLRKIKR